MSTDDLQQVVLSSSISSRKGTYALDTRKVCPQTCGQPAESPCFYGTNADVDHAS